MNLVTMITENPLSSVLGALFLVWLAYRLRLTEQAVRHRIEAGRRIAEAFRPELDALVQNSCNARLVLTDEVFKKHEAAIRNNKRKLSWWVQFRLHRAWRDLVYHSKDKKQMYPYYEQYFDAGSLDMRATVRPFAIARIQRIISIVE